MFLQAYEHIVLGLASCRLYVWRWFFWEEKADSL